MSRTHVLPKGAYWGDLLMGADRQLECPQRKASLASRAVPQGRLRARQADGLMLVTSPSEPMTLFACDAETGAMRWRYGLQGRFDPDTRLAVAIDTDRTILLAGCGIGALQRVSPEGALLADYYALQERHRGDFAWRGVVSVAPGLNGRVYLADRYMYGAVLVIDPQLGHMADIGTRGPAPMSMLPGVGELVCVSADGAGGIWALSIGPAMWRHYDADLALTQTIALEVEPWHYLDQPMGLHADGHLVTFHAHPHRLLFTTIDMGD